ncbi:MAG TPA: hypothetical protein P5228_06515 [Bacteroidales bacterium]|nr:hypothetical protein [Bacteroidales bacterium]HRZ49697.1 hypothetical protein [Bacteroidales bacterium]
MENVNLVPQARKKRSLWAFIFGLLLMVGIVAYVVYYYQPLDQDYCFESINQDEAELMLKNYQQSAQSEENLIIRGYSISQCHLKMMEQLFEAFPDAQAVRFYFGQQEGSKDTFLIAAAVNAEKRNEYDKILKAKLGTAGLCPRYCDEQSPLLEPADTSYPEYSLGEPVSVETARQLISGYQMQNVLSSGIMKGMVVSRQQFATMMEMSGSDNIGGFRIYFGAKHKAAEVITLICATTMEGRDISDLIISAPVQSAGLCPRYCDNSEPADPEEVGVVSVW